MKSKAPKKITPKPGEVWLNCIQLAKILGMGRSHFDKTINLKIGAADKRRDGRHVVFRASAVVKVYVDGLREKITDGQSLRAPEDVWKAERAKLLVLKREELEGKLLRQPVVHQVMIRLALILKGACENLRRVHGDGAAGMIDEAINDFEREVEMEFAK